MTSNVAKQTSRTKETNVVWLQQALGQEKPVASNLNWTITLNLVYSKQKIKMILTKTFDIDREEHLTYYLYPNFVLEEHTMKWQCNF